VVPPAASALLNFVSLPDKISPTLGCPTVACEVAVEPGACACALAELFVEQAPSSAVTKIVDRIASFFIVGESGLSCWL